MEILKKCANLLAKPKARVALILVGLVPTVVLGSLATQGLFVVVAEVPFTEETAGWYWWIAVPSILGCIGLVSAWIRLLVPPIKFKEHLYLRVVVVLGISAGLSISLFYGLGSPVTSPFFWAMAGISMIGIFLIGATVGESDRSNN